MATTPRAQKAETPRYEPVLQLPPLRSEQYEALRDNIALHGVLVPILVDGDGAVRGVIDGNHRKRIADELGYDCPEIVKDDLSAQEKRTLARALNLARRQLDQAGKRAIIADQLRETPGRSNRWIGKQLGVHHATVAAVRTGLEITGQIVHCETRLGADNRTQPAVRNGAPDGDDKTVAARRRSYNCTHHFDMVGRPADIETPPGLCRFLHDLIAPLHEVRTILDPSAGRGNLTRPWRGVRVISYEIKQGRDFLTTTGRIACDLVLCNPPFSADNGRGKVNLVPLFLERILEAVRPETPIVLFAPMTFRLGQTTASARWRWLRDECPPITSIVSLPRDVFPSVDYHCEILLFNTPRLRPHYFLPDEYL
jgi:type I restriction enzyme M protein